MNITFQILQYLEMKALKQNDDFSKVTISQILDDFFYLSVLSIGRCLIKYKLLVTTYLAMPFLA
jgi:hypothetical protein